MDTERPMILLVEDNEDDVDLTLRALKKERLNADIVVARDGEEALDVLFARGAHAARTVAERPRLVLLDINLPKLSGIEVLKQLRRDERTQLLPVVMLTTSAEDRDLVESYTSGANSYVQKPVDYQQFMKAVRDLGGYWLDLNRQPY